jgi:K+ transporter
VHRSYAGVFYRGAGLGEFLAVAGGRTSDNLPAAYGIAVSADMVLTTLLLCGLSLTANRPCYASA